MSNLQVSVPGILVLESKVARGIQHCHKLLNIKLCVTIDIELLNQVSQLVLFNIDSVGNEHAVDLVRREVARVVGVCITEHSSEFLDPFIRLNKLTIHLWTHQLSELHQTDLVVPVLVRSFDHFGGAFLRDLVPEPLISLHKLPLVDFAAHVGVKDLEERPDVIVNLLLQLKGDITNALLS